MDDNWRRFASTPDAQLDAAQTNWTATTGSWFDSGNWTAGAPISSVDAIIDNGGISQLFLADAQAQDVYIGNAISGSLQIGNGANLASRFSSIGHLADADGAVTVTGENSRWNSIGVSSAMSSLSVGGNGKGTLTIADGGVVETQYGKIGITAESEGDVTVTGHDSIFTNSYNLTIGDNGKGILSVFDGATVTNSWGIIANNAGSEGTVTVLGDRSTWTNQGSQVVAGSGMGVLIIAGGGTVSAPGVSIGAGAGGNGIVTVSDADSTWAIENYLQVGDGSTGELTIANGGAVWNVDGAVGFRINSDGEVNVTGQGSNWTNGGELLIGDIGRAKMSITDGGVVNSATAVLASSFLSEAVVSVADSGSSWNNSGDLYVSANGKATLLISDGGFVQIGGDTSWGHRRGGQHSLRQRHLDHSRSADRCQKPQRHWHCECARIGFRFEFGFRCNSRASTADSAGEPTRPKHCG